MAKPDPTRAEDCRYEVRHHLATRNTLARDARTIQRSLARDNDYTMEEVESALVFLVSLGQVQVIPAALGSTKRYQITAAGTLADERDE